MKFFIFSVFLLSFSGLALGNEERLYREAENFERHLLFKQEQALQAYQRVMVSRSRVWSRRAAFRMVTLIRNIHFSAGRSEKIRRRLVGIYKSILVDLPSHEYDPELWLEIQKEIRWTRLGLLSPKMVF